MAGFAALGDQLQKTLHHSSVHVADTVSFHDTVHTEYSRGLGELWEHPIGRRVIRSTADDQLRTSGVS